MTVTCPRCGKPAEFKPSNRYRPFCSERCATLDLGSWADEKYRVPVEPTESNDLVSENEKESESVNKKSESESAPFANLPPKYHLN
jgi:endogenous inhibitor of DNA gyrase (YacG/DUF329 family)